MCRARLPRRARVVGVGARIDPAGEWKMDEAERAQLFAISMQEQMARLSWTGAEFDEAPPCEMRTINDGAPSNVTS